MIWTTYSTVVVDSNTVELGYNAMKGTEYFMSL
jgi:hypothetical protein